MLTERWSRLPPDAACFSSTRWYTCLGPSSPKCIYGEMRAVFLRSARNRSDGGLPPPPLPVNSGNRLNRGAPIQC